jgi:hypothetical protein
MQNIGHGANVRTGLSCMVATGWQITIKAVSTSPTPSIKRSFLENKLTVEKGNNF